MTEFLLLVACLAIVLGLAGMAYYVVAGQPSGPSPLGRRGRNRKRARRQLAWFRILEPPIRLLGSRIDGLLPRAWGFRIERRLLEAGYPLGLSAGELVAISFAAAALCWVALSATVPRSGDWLPLVLLGTLSSPLIPFARLSALRSLRGRRITRSLPSVLELIVMCMSAGLDLPRALRCVVESATEPSDPIVEELETVVRELELGRTRREALRGLADRVPTTDVQELVNSVIQSEEKGVPLTKSLLVQSRTLKLRRSMNAEQTASNAALMLVGPMSLIFLCVIALLLGPVLIRTTIGGLGG